jgi:nitroreductase
MSLSRRKVLIFGGASAVVAAGASWGMLASPSMKRAAAPWFAAGRGFVDPRLNALSYAILAPNPHNRQPWEFILVGDDQVDVRIDLNKRLPQTDPFDRQITIGFGCMLELFRQASAELGYATEITPFPDGEGGERLGEGRIASIRLTAGDAVKDPLFAAVLERRSTKEPYTEQPVEQASLDSIGNSVVEEVSFGASNAPEMTDSLSANAWEAWKIEYETDATRRESIDLMRIGNDAAVAQPDGIDLAGPMMSAAHAVGLITKETLDTPGTTAFDTGYDLYRAMMDSTKAWAWLVTEQNTRLDQLNVGASWVRLNLAAQREGLAVHPWSQALQEFPEMAKPYSELRDLLAPEGGTVQMFARVGYGPAVDASPRWPLEAKLVDA